MGISTCAPQVRSSRKRRHRPSSTAAGTQVRSSRKRRHRLSSTAAGTPQQHSSGISGPQRLHMPRRRSCVSVPGSKRRRRRGSGPCLSLGPDRVITSAAAFAVVRHAPGAQRHAPPRSAAAPRSAVPSSACSALLRAMGGPRRAAGSAEWPIALLMPACSGGGKAAWMTTDRIRGCAVSKPRRSAGSYQNLDYR